jgi:radical SAM protein with 4Fe4S-binding SPASM domain
MMLVGLGEPLMDRKIFDRIEYCASHRISTLLSTNGTLLDAKAAARLLASRLDHITLSFDGASKETYEYYRRGARFQKVRDNFAHFARIKYARKAKLQVVVQIVRMERNIPEVKEFRRFWRGVDGVDLVRVKEDETNLMKPAGGRRNSKARPCHYLWRGAMYVKHDGRVYPCCQSYALGGAPVGDLNVEDLPEIFNSGEMQQLRKMHSEGRAAEIDMCARCGAAVPHPLFIAGSLLLHAKYVRRLLPVVEGLVNGASIHGHLPTPGRNALFQIRRS